MRALASRRAAIAVMAGMAAVLGLASLVPEPDFADPKRLAELRARRPIVYWIGRNLRPQEIVRSPAFLGLPSLLFVGVSASIVERLRAHLRRGDRAVVVWHFRVERTFTLAAGLGDVASLLAERLREARYGLQAAGPHRLEGARGRLGFWGSIGFHVGLLCVLVGVVASGLTRLNGEILLTEGFPAPLAASSLFSVSGAGRFPDLPGHSLAIRDFVADYSPQGTPVDFALILSVLRGGTTLAEQQVRVNQAFRWGGLQLTLQRYGFAPEILARDPAGSTAVEAVSVLQLLPPGREDAVPLENGGSLGVRLFPDFATIQGVPASRSLQPVRPVLFFEWRDGAGRALAQGRVALSDVTRAGGYSVALPSLRYWAGFVVARDEGLVFFAVGSLLGSLGVALRFAFPDQSIRLEWEPASSAGVTVRLLASSRFFPALHEEQVDRLVARIGDPHARA